MRADNKHWVRNTMRNANRKNKAFSLVELLIVIIIIAVLAAVAIPRFANSSQRSKESALRANLKLYRNAVELFKADTGVFPAALADLAATSAPANGLDSAGASTAITATDWKGPYLNTIENDPISSAAFSYGTTSPNVGKVTSSAGAPYNGW
jgi:type II secretion system protein G